MQGVFGPASRGGARLLRALPPSPRGGRGERGYKVTTTIAPVLVTGKKKPGRYCLVGYCLADRRASSGHQARSIQVNNLTRTSREAKGPTINLALCPPKLHATGRSCGSHLPPLDGKHSSWSQEFSRVRAQAVRSPLHARYRTVLARPPTWVGKPRVPFGWNAGMLQQLFFPFLRAMPDTRDPYMRSSRGGGVVSNCYLEISRPAGLQE